MRKHAAAYNNQKLLCTCKHLKEKVFDNIAGPLAVLRDDCEVLFPNTASGLQRPAGPQRRSSLSKCRACDLGPCILALPLHEVLAKSAGEETVTQHECELESGDLLRLQISDLGIRQAFFLMLRDAAERQADTGRRTPLASELNHRIKNALQIASSIASETARHSTSVDGFLSAYEGRLSAFGQVQTMLSRNDWGPVELQAILDQAICLHDLEERRVKIAPGPAVEVPPPEALSLRLVLHELFTNALTHGALSVSGGRVDVSWKTTAGGESTVYFHWKETGGPRVAPPRKKGFGTELIELLLPFDLNGRARLRFESPGLRCELEFPLPEPGPVTLS